MTKNELSVDDFVKTRVLPEFQPVVALIRSLMKEHAPNVQELISYGIPAYRRKRILAVISPTKKDITFSFSRGSQFEDRYGLLKGVGKVSRHVKLTSSATANLTALQDYIRQALEFDDK
jgi:hypothetical protein